MTFGAARGAFFAVVGGGAAVGAAAAGRAAGGGAGAAPFGAAEAKADFRAWACSSVTPFNWLVMGKPNSLALARSSLEVTPMARANS